MAEDNGKEEEKFDFTAEGEGYISLDEAILNARLLVRQDEKRYLDRLGWEEVAWLTSESEHREATYRVVLEFRRPDRGLTEGESGLEEFLFDHNGELQDRQVLFWPNNSSAPTVTEPAPTPLPTPTPKPIPTPAPTPTPYSTPDQEQIVSLLRGKEGTVAAHHVPSFPTQTSASPSDTGRSSGFPVLPVVIGLAVVGILAVVSVVFL